MPLASGLSVFVGRGGLVGVGVSVDVGVNVGVTVGVEVSVHFTGRMKEMPVGGAPVVPDDPDDEHAARSKNRTTMKVLLTLGSFPDFDPPWLAAPEFIPQSR
jgi:hypothetical protein